MAYVLLLGQRVGIHVPEAREDRCRWSRRRTAGDGASARTRLRGAGARRDHRRRPGRCDGAGPPLCTRWASATATWTRRAVLLTPDGDVAFDDFSVAQVSASDYYANRDAAAVIVQTARQAGNERAGRGSDAGARQGAAGRDHPARPAGRAPGTRWAEVRSTWARCSRHSARTSRPWRVSTMSRR